jgi:uncharacterized membrane protein (DUF485 family)
MIMGSIGIPYGIYFYFIYAKSYMEVWLNNALIGASIAILAMGYLMYSFLRIIGKFKRKCLEEQTDSQGKR